MNHVKKDGVTVTIVRNNLLLQYISGDTWYGTEDHWIWKTTDSGNKWRKICKLKPASGSSTGLIKDFLLRSAPVRRIRKNIGIHNLVVLPTGTLVAQYDKIYRFGSTDRYAEPVFDFQKQGIAGPLKNGLCHDPQTDTLYFGEYRIQRPAAIRIVRGKNDGRDWETCYQFPKGAIRHVHGLYYDSYRQRIWICTGDNDEESGLYYTDDDFQTVHCYGSGDQSWRMVSLLIDEHSLIWGSDAGQDAPEHIKNHIYRLDLKTGKKRQLCCIDKPAYYSARLADGSMCIATTYEPGIQRPVTPSADLWWSRDGMQWDMLHSFSFSPSLRSYGTRYATLFLPNYGPGVGACYCTPVNVTYFDFTALKLSVKK